MTLESKLVCTKCRQPFRFGQVVEDSPGGGFHHRTCPTEPDPHETVYTKEVLP